MRLLKRPLLAALLVSSTLLLSACDSVEERAEKHFQSALALISDGDIDRAMVELRNAFTLDGRHVGARRTMAELQLKRGNHQGAYRQYLRLAEYDLNDLESRIKLSELAFATSSWEELDRHGTRAEELAPDDPRVKMIKLARDYRSSIVEKDEAKQRDLGQLADEHLATIPDSVLLRTTVMDNALRQRNYERALQEIDWMIAHEPVNIRHYQERLRVLAELGDNKAIEVQLLEMVKVFPDDPANLQLLIQFYVARNELDLAEKVLRDRATAANEDPGPTVDLISFLNTFRNSEAAGVEIAKAIAQHADPVPFQIIQANFDFSRGDRAKAIATLEGVVKTSESSEQTGQLKVALAKMMAATGNEVGARQQVEEVLAKENTHPGALKMQAAWQILADNTDAAIGGLRTALDRNPRDAEAMALIADAYFRAGQPELAKDFLAQAVYASGSAPALTLRYARLLIEEKNYQPAEDILIAALRMAPDNEEILSSLGTLYLQTENFDRVRAVVATLKRGRSETAQVTANRIEAERLGKQEGIDRAMQFLEELANSVDATEASKINLVGARLRVGDKVKALELAQELRNQNPDSEALMLVLATAQVANNNLDGAIAQYRSLIEKDPRRPQLWLELYRVVLRQGSAEFARAVIEEGLSRAPESADLLWAKASFLEKDGNIKEAIAVYETLYEKNSDSVIIANNLASLLSSQAQDAESLERAWIIARRLRDTDVPAFKDTYGWILHRRGNSDEALHYLEAAAEGMPEDPVVQYRLGQVLLSLKRPQEALERFREAVIIAGPTDTRPEIVDARTRLQSSSAPDTKRN